MKTVRKPDVERPFKARSPNYKVPAVHLDWDAFYGNFCASHGNWPVQVDGVMLFEDGWTCNADSTAGPYNPPPEDVDHLVRLKVKYWKRRRGIVVGLRDRLEGLVRSLNDLQKLHGDLELVGKSTLHLLQAGVMGGQEAGFVDEHGKVMMGDLCNRLLWLANDVLDCNRALANLGERT